MVAFGLLCMLVPAGAGGYLAWQNRNAIVHVHIGNLTWTGHLYGVLVLGALLACWFILGAAFIQCRIAERRHARAAENGGGQPALHPVAQTAAPQASTGGRGGARRGRPLLQR